MAPLPHCMLPVRIIPWATFETTNHPDTSTRSGSHVVYLDDMGVRGSSAYEEAFDSMHWRYGATTGGAATQAGSTLLLLLDLVCKYICFIVFFYVSNQSEKR
ncbi:hypothetical protein BDZ89DRAFT_1046143 [Hymenopellis radicata]|nr:hypothetical protein BDZ89DRAFT_1046143 [Hymenopellis radicata]